MLALAAAGGDPAVKRAGDRMPEVFCSVLAAAFQIDLAGQPRASNSFLGLAPQWTGEMARRTLAEHLEALLDDLAAVFASEAAAEACRQRLAKRQTPAITLRLVDDLWTVVPRINAYGKRTEAETALRSVAGFRENHVIAERHGVFLILRQDIAAALAPSQLEPPTEDA
jgi:hypothetical protein